jgi:hypothetical protein
VAKPGPSCRVCASEHRSLIELAMIHKIPIRTIAKRFGLNKDALWRHRRLHLSEQLVAAMVAGAKGLDPVELEALRRQESEGLLASLARLRARLELLSGLAFEEGSIGSANQIEHTYLRSLELGARLVGDLAIQHQHIHASFLISPSYLKLRQALTSVLRKYPNVAAEVAQVLHGLEHEAADEIKHNPCLIEASAC